MSRPIELNHYYLSGKFLRPTHQIFNITPYQTQDSDHLYRRFSFSNQHRPGEIFSSRLDPSTRVFLRPAPMSHLFLLPEIRSAQHSRADPENTNIDALMCAMAQPIAVTCRELILRVSTSLLVRNNSHTPSSHIVDTRSPYIAPGHASRTPKTVVDAPPIWAQSRRRDSDACGVQTAPHLALTN